MSMVFLSIDSLNFWVDFPSKGCVWINWFEDSRRKRAVDPCLFLCRNERIVGFTNIPNYVVLNSPFWVR